MRALFVTTYPPAACGIAEYSYDLVINMLQITPKAEITILKLRTEKELSPDEYDLSKVEMVDTGEYAGSVKYDRLSKLVDGKYDVIHVQHEYGIFRQDLSFIKFLRTLRRHCDKLVLTMHNVRHALWYPGIDRYQRKLVEAVDYVVVHSVAQELELLHQGANPSKVVVLPHGTRIAEIVDRDKALRGLSLPLKGEEMVVLIQGFLRKDKGLHVIFEAFRRVVRGVDNAVLLIAGEPQGSDNRKYVEEFIKNISRLGGRAILLNKYLSRRELELVYSASHLVVFPYVDVGGDIGVSGALHTALGSFKPILCARTPRLIECYERVPMLAFPSNDVEALARKLILTLTHYGEVLEYVRPLVEYALMTSWVNISKLHLGLYNDGEPYRVDYVKYIVPKLSTYHGVLDAVKSLVGTTCVPEIPRTDVEQLVLNKG